MERAGNSGEEADMDIKGSFFMGTEIPRTLTALDATK
jgi:hypothetical protein